MFYEVLYLELNFEKGWWISVNVVRQPCAYMILALVNFDGFFSSKLLLLITGSMVSNYWLRIPILSFSGCAVSSLNVCYYVVCSFEVIILVILMFVIVI